MSTMILAAASATLPAGRDRRADLVVGRHHLRADHAQDAGNPGAAEGPSALGLLVASLAACTVMSARTVLEQHPAEAEAEVTVSVSYDIGPPTVVHRRVTVGVDLAVDTRARLLVALEHTPVTDLLRPGLVIRTRLEPSRGRHEAGRREAAGTPEPDLGGDR